MPGVSVARYVAGTAWVLIVGLSHVRIAIVVKRLALSRLSQAGAVLGACVVLLTSLLTAGQLLGAVGLLSWWPVLVVSAAGWGVAERVLRQRPVPASVAEPMLERPADAWFHALVAAGCVAAVGWQWTTHLADAFGRGMMHTDNLWYHGPFAARFLQTGDFGDLGTLGYTEARAYPLNSELLHALMTMPFRTDLLVPVSSHLFAALAIGAAYVLGRHWSVGALAMLGVTVLLSLPLIGSTQPGQMYNDVMAAGLLLAVVALLVDGGLHHGPVAVAGMALGAAIATKLSVVGVAVPLALGVLVVALVARRRSVAVTWLLTTALTGSYWFARNWMLYNSPIASVDFDLGPFELRGDLVRTEPGESLLATLDNLDEVGEYYLDSLRTGVGPLWAVTLAIAVMAPIVVMIRARDWRLLGAAAAFIGLITFPILPITGGLPFVNNLRYGTGALMLALPLAAVAVAGYRWLQVGLAAVSVVLIVTNLVSDHRGRVAAWPGYHLWGFLAAVVLVGGAWLIFQRDREDPLVPPLRPPSSPLAVVVATVVVLGAAGWLLQRFYLDNRYVDSRHPDELLQRPFADITDSTVDVLGTDESYAMFGPDLSNHVTVHNQRLKLKARDPARPCEYWRRTIHRGAGYIVVANNWVYRPTSPEQRQAWFESDPATTVLEEQGDFSVYYHDAALDSSAC